MSKVFIVLLSIIPCSVVYAQDAVTIDRNLNRSTPSNYKHSIPPIEEVAGNKVFSLLLDNMINFMGKVAKEEFEIYVGEPVGEEDGFIVYEVESSFEKIPIAIRCFYHEKTGKLINVHFPTPAYNNYLYGILKYKKEETIVKTYRDRFNVPYQYDVTVKEHLLLQIFSWGGVSYGYK
ncbi:MAG: hypothetical protein QM660_04875 [Dysgonomonas sp.]